VSNPKSPLKDLTDNVSSALGHPLGCTGTRQVVTALSELRRQDKRVAVTSMCIGTVSIRDSVLMTSLLTII
jgi:acetyl-CoA acetyltransferase